MKIKPILIMAILIAWIASPGITQMSDKKPQITVQTSKQVIPGNAEVQAGVVYGKIGERELKMDLMFPKEKSEKPLPVVVWIHGGAWLEGTKEPNVALPLVKYGFFTASIEYRLTPEAIWPAQIHDCKAAIRFLRANAKKFNIDPDRIGVWGASAGGHLVNMLGLTGDDKALEGEIGPLNVSSKVQAVVDFFGPSDLLTMGDFPSDQDHNAPNSPESLLVGGAVKEVTEKSKNASPINYVSKDDPPFLIAHGDQDGIVPYNQSEILYKALRDAGVKVEFITVKGGGHGGWNEKTEPSNKEVHQKVINFFVKTLKPQAVK